MPEGQDSLVIIVDYRSATLRTNPSISVAAKVLTILQNHYVERLGRAIVLNLPFLLEFFYRGISPFLDPVSRDKMRFNPDLKTLVPDDHLDANFGGSFQYEFEPKSYWESLISYVSFNFLSSRLFRSINGLIQGLSYSGRRNENHGRGARRLRTHNTCNRGNGPVSLHLFYCAP
jgi:hypothetical protein